MRFLRAFMYGSGGELRPLAWPAVAAVLVCVVAVVAANAVLVAVPSSAAGATLATGRPAPESPYKAIPAATDTPGGRPGASPTPQPGIGDGASGCLPRVVRDAGWLDSCWQVYRNLNEADLDHDHYTLEFYGTAHGDGPAGIRWATLRATVTGGDLSNIATITLAGPADGPCRRATLSAGLFTVGAERLVTACERWEITQPFGGEGDDRTVSMAWTCPHCLFGIHDVRDVAIVEQATLLEGTTPTWDLAADLGN